MGLLQNIASIIDVKIFFQFIYWFVVTYKQIRNHAMSHNSQMYFMIQK